jgi:dolichyl-phosphooligosaccharide-protein glycotransferase
MRKYLTVGLSLFAALSLSIFFRCYPVFFPQFEKYAERTVDSQVKQKIALEVNNKYPGLADLAKVKLFEAAIADYKKENKKILDQQKQEEFARLKDRFQDKFGQTYLMELDGWHWARYVKNIDRFGGVGDQVINGKQHDNLMVFPQGSDVNWSTLLFYASWAAYKAFTLFKPVVLFDFIFYIPLFFMSVFIVLLYFFCYRYWGNLTALICCIFVGTAPIFIPRSCAGWFDFDILTMIYPLLIVWTYLLAYNACSWPRSIGWMIAAAFALSLFCASWVGWPLILVIIFFYEIIVLANCLSERLQYRQDTSAETRKHLILPAVFLFSGLFWIILISGLIPLETLLTQFNQAVSLNKPVTSVFWPNVLSTVGELKNGDYLSVARAIGGVFPLALLLLCMLGIFLNIKEYKGLKREFLLILVVWFMTMFYLCSRGIRFSMYLLVPLGIFLGWGIQETYRFLIRKNWRLGIIPLALVVVGLCVSMISRADNTAKGVLPLMDDSWYSALTTIKKHTPEDSVINSWWDFGDWFKAVGERRVIFDGQTQNIPQAYWMARVLLTDSEDEAVGILRMLNNGGNSAFEIIDKNVADPFVSISLLKKAIMLSPEEGRFFLEMRLPPAEAQKVAEILYSRPKQKAYLVTDSSMIGKMVPISYLGNWDFIKIYLIRALRSKPKDQIFNDLLGFGLDRSQAENYYQEASLIGGKDLDSWVSLRASISSISYQKKSSEDQVLFNNGFIYTPGKKTIYSYSSYEERYRVPKSLFLADGGNITETEFPQSDSNYSALVLENKYTYKLVLLSPELARSMFVRLHMLNGKGLKHFLPFTREGDDQNQIWVYEVKWD